MNQCPLCSNNVVIRDFHIDKQRSYNSCLTCGLVIVPESFHLSASAEKAQYDLHQNDPQDGQYRTFLERTFTPLVGRLHPGAIGLDFGCGPGPLMSRMGEERAISIENYDPYYYDYPDLLKKKYDFITMTEVIEHIAQPRALLELLDSMMKPGSILAVMTKRLINLERFKSWHYKNDPTHISFYSLMTFQWVAKQFNWQLEIIDKDVVFFTRQL